MDKLDIDSTLRKNYARPITGYGIKKAQKRRVVG